MDFDFTLETISPTVSTLLNIGNTGALQLPSGTTAQEPATVSAGAVRWNTTVPQLELYNGSAWVPIGTGTSTNPILQGNASVTIPIGTTAQRPTTPVSGMLRYNSTIGLFEFYQGAWLSYTGTIDKSTVSVVQTGTTSANMFSYSVPANVLTANNILRTSLGGTWGNTATTALSINITISYGGTVMWAGTSGTMATGTTGWNIELYLAGNNSTTSQTLTGKIILDSVGSPTTGVGSILAATITASPQISTAIAGTSAVASTSAQVYTVAIVASATGSTITKNFHITELM